MSSSFSINSDGVIKWGEVSGAFGYDYQISYDGGEWSTLSHASYNNISGITNYKQYQTIKIRVRASGNGDNTVTSQWIEWVYTKQ